MGVPKFFRWISERYPNISRVINDNQIPDFDNFYLDMNGIIHQCSHINEDNCETNVSEEEIFRNIFHYLDFLFRLIKPKKVFFMAIDGVAPRAKMNQQRARRFRAGQDRMKKLKKIAEATNRPLDELLSQHFDTNSITPGTQFMANLHEQLKYFIHIKLTTDPLWENVDVHLSGHLTPGEGEHKIMEYIRYTRLQPGYDVNTRHCLYGLDADLIMLGLVTHEIHFALLREEVKYGSKKVSKILTPEEITWHLFHTCLLRNYIDLEFRSIKESLKVSYNLECIIDDWILMAYLVGNDFIPHLPHIHIKEEALSILWDAYKVVLPTLDGYMNESGELNLVRFETYLTELAKYDHQRYADENDTFKNLNKVTGRKKQISEKKTEAEPEDDIDGGFNFAALDKLNTTEPHSAPVIERPLSNDENVKVAVEVKVSDSSSTSDENDLSSDLENSEDEDEKKKISTEIPKLINEDNTDKLPLIEAEFRQHKNHYYREKMKINFTSCEELQFYVNQYIEALQWILKYYYQGCPSWSWFYPQHYAPYLSDLRNFKDLKIDLQKGTPFKPFEQLLSVLPPTSRFLLPDVLQPLMIDPSSPLLSFYPEHFELDQNEKKQDWEAIVLLPFIDEKLLLNSITQYYNRLKPNEQSRNQHLPSLCYRTTASLQPIGNSLQANPCFPSLQETRASCTEIPVDQYQSDGLYFKHNHQQESNMIIYPKFPSLNVLPYRYDYKTNAVNIFEMRSKAATLVLSLVRQPDSDCIAYNSDWNPKDEKTLPPFQITNIKGLVHRYLGKRVFVDWPHFQYGIVCAVSDFRQTYTWTNIPGGSYYYFEPENTEENFDYKNYTQKPIYVSQCPFEIGNDYNKQAVFESYTLKDNERDAEYIKAVNINRRYENRQGISIGPIPVLLYVCPLIGYRIRCSSTSDKCKTNMCFSNQALAYPLQTTLFNLPNYKSDLDQTPRTINDYFKVNDQIFALKQPFYSVSGFVQEVKQDSNGKYIVVCQMESSDSNHQPDMSRVVPKLLPHHLKYYTAQEIADKLKTIPCVVSKITGKINLFPSSRRRRRAIPTNIGLSWKMNKPVKQLHGYTKKIDEIWYYSEAAVTIISEYMTKFPQIITEIQNKPKDDNYYEAKIWPDQNAKKEVQQLRAWIKSLPTYSLSLTDDSWRALDSPVINELDKSIKSFYTKRAEKSPAKKGKIVPFEPEALFKSSESLGMCDPDTCTTFDLYDRVVNVRFGAGVPVGTRGTIVGIMYNRNHFDTYYEVLFDNLPLNSLDAILHGKNQSKCRIKVHSYHLMNYSHSLRLRSVMYHPQQSLPAGYNWEQCAVGYDSPGQHQSYYSNQRNTQEKNTGTKPKSAPPLTTDQRPRFAKTEPEVNKSPSETTVQDASLPPPSAENLPNQQIVFTSLYDGGLLQAPYAAAPSNSTPEQMLFRAIQDSGQMQTPDEQAVHPNTQLSYNPDPSGFAQTQYYQPALNIDSMNSFLFQQQPPINPYQEVNPFMFNGTEGFSLNNLPVMIGQSGYPIDGFPQQWPTQIQSPSSQTGPPPPRSQLSHESPPFIPQQTTPPTVTNKDALKFVPSQVLRNIPKK
ncbi:unnamed protein product [Adineta ricciae]|uniref:5'-3' exoribonuclease 1 n=1 Tax=Adineta ricciae TaxID=249248 RepID=A0A813S577_ADIRI|nr:unnamed protein product [Adineta ricciae]CAF0820842.1 unnamed protein product [Adineta ricciae]